MSAWRMRRDASPLLCTPSAHTWKGGHLRKQRLGLYSRTTFCRVSFTMQRSFDERSRCSRAPARLTATESYPRVEKPNPSQTTTRKQVVAAYKKLLRQTITRTSETSSRDTPKPRLGARARAAESVSPPCTSARRRSDIRRATAAAHAVAAFDPAGSPPHASTNSRVRRKHRRRVENRRARRRGEPPQIGD